MNWEYNPIYDNSQDEEDVELLQYQMSKIREETLLKLSDLEISALFENIDTFKIFYIQEMQEQSLQYRIY